MTSETTPEVPVGDHAVVVAGLVDALRRAHRLCDTTSDNLPELLREALEQVARELGGVEELVRHRPGSWEAEDVRHLAWAIDFDPGIGA